jgi:glycopeptide antibiotics resistance protein
MHSFVNQKRVYFASERKTFVKKRWWILFLGYIVFMIAGTLAVRGHSALEWVYLLIPPGPLQEKLVYVLQHHHPVVFTRLLILTDTLINILLFMPIGFVFYRLVSPRTTLSIQALLCLAFGLGMSASLIIEMLQAYVPQRVPSVSDSIANAAGMVFGCYLPYFWHHARKRET